MCENTGLSNLSFSSMMRVFANVPGELRMGSIGAILARDHWAETVDRLCSALLFATAVNERSGSHLG